MEKEKQSSHSLTTTKIVVRRGINKENLKKLELYIKNGAHKPDIQDN